MTNSYITLSEVSALHNQLELDLRSKIKEFEAKTGLYVKSVDLLHNQHLIAPKITTAAVRITLEFPPHG